MDGDGGTTDTLCCAECAEVSSVSLPFTEANWAEIEGTGGISSSLVAFPLVSPPAVDCDRLRNAALKLLRPVVDGVGDGEEPERSCVALLLLGARTSLEKKLGAMVSRCSVQH